MNRLIEKLIAGEDLSADEASDLVSAMIRDDADAVHVGAALTALRAKGETADELRGFARTMLGHAVSVPFDCGDAVDIVGTGGDGSNSLNLSTGSALLAAVCGVPVVKHGNRAVSGRSGSADVLEALGFAIPSSPVEAGAQLGAAGFTFLYAPDYHPALGALKEIRRRLGVRTIFNILGPLLNPAKPPYAVIGAPRRDIASLMADALSSMGVRRAFVVHGADDWDEPTPLGPFSILDVRDGGVTTLVRDPADFGISRCVAEDLAGGDPDHNADELRMVFEGRRNAHRDALSIGAALALEVSGRVGGLAEGLEVAGDALDSGRAVALLDRVIMFEGAHGDG